MIAEKKHRAANNQAKSYIPNGKAAEFIKMVGEKGEDHPFVNMFVGANGTSKTATGANILANLVYGVQNEYFDYPLFRNFPYLKKARIISDPTTIKEKTIPELKKWFPKNEASRLPDAPYETTKEGKNYISKFITNTGWEIDIMSTEQELKEYESVDLGFVWIDEPMPKDRFNATIFRGRTGMIIIWTFTPLFHAGWIKDWMNEKADGKYADYIEADLEANCKMHGVRGILEHKHIKLMAEAVPEEEKEARVFGKFGHLIGRVHKKFSRKIHIIKPFPIDPKKFTVYHALDPHPRVPDHALWMAIDRNGQKYVCGELALEGTVTDLSERIKAFENSMQYRIEQRIIDPSAYNDDQHNEEASVGSRLFDLGLSYVKGSKDLMAGIKRTNDALDYEMRGGEWVRKPEIFIFDTCAITIKQLEEYVWGENRGRSADDKQPNARPRDKNDHQVENLHRLLLAELSFVPYVAISNTMPFDQFEIERSLDPY